MMILKKNHKNQSGEVVVALCDSDIRGKRIESENIVLDAASDFYGDDEADLKTIISSLSKANSVNAIGKESVKLLLDKGYIKQDGVKKADGVLYTIAALK